MVSCSHGIALFAVVALALGSRIQSGRIQAHASGKHDDTLQTHMGQGGSMCDKWLVVEYKGEENEESGSLALDTWEDKVLFVKFDTSIQCTKTYTAKCAKGEIEVTQECQEDANVTAKSETRWIFTQISRSSTTEKGQIIRLNKQLQDHFSLLDDRVELHQGYVKWWASSEKPPGATMVAQVEGQLAESATEDLDWVNLALARLWPKIDQALWHLIDTWVNPMFAEDLPWVLRGLKIRQFTLGAPPPILGPIKVYSTRDGLKFGIDLDYRSGAEIHIQDGPIHVGINGLKVKGHLIIQLAPLIGELPIIGGVSAYFLDTPQLDFDFDGVAGLLDIPGVNGLVRGALKSIISKLFVLPNVFGYPLATEAQGVDPSYFKQAMPVGVMRVTALSASDLAGEDHHLFSNTSTSDPYMTVQIAEEHWQTEVVKKSLEPVWTENNVHDFTVFDRQQTIQVEVYNDNRIESDDLLGRATPIPVGRADEVSNGELELFGKEGRVTTSSKEESFTVDSIANSRGKVNLDFQWLNIVPFRTSGGAGSMVRMRIKKILLPEGLGSSAEVKASLVGRPRRTAANGYKAEDPVTVSKYTPVMANSAPVIDVTTQAIVAKCRKKSMSDALISEITGFTVEQLRATSVGDIFVNVDSHLYFFPETIQQDNEILVEVMDHNGQSLGEAQISMRSVLESPQTKLVTQLSITYSKSAKALSAASWNPYFEADKGAGDEQEVKVDVEVSVYNLRPDAK